MMERATPEPKTRWTGGSVRFVKESGGDQDQFRLAGAVLQHVTAAGDVGHLGDVARGGYCLF